MENVDQERDSIREVGERSLVRDRSPGNVAPRRGRVPGPRRAFYLIRFHNRTTTFHVEYAFFVMSLFCLFQLKYQNKNVSAFETHPTSVGAFFITLCGYCMAQFIAKNLNHAPNYSQIFSRASGLSAALSSVSIASIILPSSVSSLIMFIIWGIVIIIWGILFVIDVRILFQTLYQWFYQMIANAVFVHVSDLYTRFMEQRVMDQQRPPV